jgi:hypothetical protein
MGREFREHGEKGSAFRILIETPEGNRLLVRPNGRWVNNIKMDITII